MWAKTRLRDASPGGIKITFRKMSKCWSVHLVAFIGCCGLICLTCLGGPGRMLMAAEVSSGAAGKPASDNLVRIMDGSDLPDQLLALMSSSRMKYLKGSDLIASGDPDRAREAFDEAVNLLLMSNWDFATTPALKGFFEDLVHQIMDQEASYFIALEKPDTEIESAAVDELENLDLIPIVVDPDLRDSLLSDLAEAKFEIPITINERVLKSLKYWLDSGRKRLEDGLIRSGRYRSTIEKIFREESIPVDLLYLAQVESRFKPNAVSKAQAKGIWQFRRSTAIRYGLKVTRDVDERSDPEKSTRAAARYLKDLYAMSGDWNLALAAYNWGEGKVRRLIQSTDLEDFWQLADLNRKVPAETKNHVSLILACVVIGNNPEKYGFPTQLDPPINFDRVSISKPIDLRAAAKALGISVDELKRLNPSIRRFYTPSDDPDFQLKIPIDSGPGVQGKLAALPKAVFEPPADFNGRHKIQLGETLSEIAVLYNVSVDELERANDLQSRHRIRAGSWLYVPPKPDEKKSASKRFISPARLPNLFKPKPEAGKTEVVATEIHGPPRNGSAKP